MIRILVTGSNGQLGQSLEELAGKYKNLALVFKSSTAFDITDPASAERIFSEGDFAYCINCAAYTNVNKAETHPKEAFSVNAEGVKNIALACRKHEVVLIHISTDYVFDGANKAGYTVHDIPNPINVYGQSKLKGEVYIQEILKEYFIVRTSWLYSKYGKNFYKTILQKAKAGEDLQVTDEETGCPTNANNLAIYILDLIKTKDTNYGIRHFTDGEAMTWYDFAKRILSKDNLNKSVTVVKGNSVNSIVQRPKNSILL